MNLFELKKDIRAKTMGHFYVFCGLEREGMKIYWEQMSCRTDREVLFVDTVKEALGQRPSLLEKPKVIVVNNDKDFTAAESVWDTMSQRLSKNILVVTYDALNKNSKFYKRFTDVCVMFDYFTPEVLTYHIQKHLTVSDKTAKDIINACGGSYGRIMLEIDKILRISNALPDWTHDEVVAEMLARGVIHEDVGDLIFTLGNSILRKDIETAYTCVRDGDIPPLKLIQVLYNSMKRLMLVQMCKEQGYRDAEITKETGISSKEIWGISHNLNVRQSGELARCLHVLRKCEKAIKEGVLCEEHVVDYLLVTLL